MILVATEMVTDVTVRKSGLQLVSLFAYRLVIDCFNALVISSRTVPLKLSAVARN